MSQASSIFEDNLDLARSILAIADSYHDFTASFDKRGLPCSLKKAPTDATKGTKRGRNVQDEEQPLAKVMRQRGGDDNGERCEQLIETNRVLLKHNAGLVDAFDILNTDAKPEIKFVIYPKIGGARPNIPPPFLDKDNTGKLLKRAYDYEDTVVSVFNQVLPPSYKKEFRNWTPSINDGQWEIPAEENAIYICMNELNEKGKSTFQKAVLNYFSPDTPFSKVGLLTDCFKLDHQSKELLEGCLGTLADSKDHTTSALFNFNGLAMKIDKAGKMVPNRLDMTIVPKENELHCEIQQTFDTHVQMIFNSSGNYLVWRDVKFQETEFDNLYISVRNLCNAFDNPAKLTNDALANIISTSLSGATNAKLKEKLLHTFAQGNESDNAYGLINDVFNIKRSLDYGQVYFVQFLNEKKNHDINLLLYDFKRNLSDKVPLPDEKIASLPLDTFSCFVLLTFDRLCYLKCCLENVPCIYMKDGNILLFTRPKHDVALTRQPASQLQNSALLDVYTQSQGNRDAFKNIVNIKCKEISNIIIQKWRLNIINMLTGTKLFKYKFSGAGKNKTITILNDINLASFRNTEGTAANFEGFCNVRLMFVRYMLAMNAILLKCAKELESINVDAAFDACEAFANADADPTKREEAQKRILAMVNIGKIIMLHIPHNKDGTEITASMVTQFSETVQTMLIQTMSDKNIVSRFLGNPRYDIDISSVSTNDHDTLSRDILSNIEHVFITDEQQHLTKFNMWLLALFDEMFQNPAANATNVSGRLSKAIALHSKTASGVTMFKSEWDDSIIPTENKKDSLELELLQIHELIDIEGLEPLCNLLGVGDFKAVRDCYNEAAAIALNYREKELVFKEFVTNYVGRGLLSKKKVAARSRNNNIFNLFDLLSCHFKEVCIPKTSLDYSLPELQQVIEKQANSTEVFTLPMEQHNDVIKAVVAKLLLRARNVKEEAKGNLVPIVEKVANTLPTGQHLYHEAWKAFFSEQDCSPKMINIILEHLTLSYGNEVGEHILFVETIVNLLHFDHFVAVDPETMFDKVYLVMFGWSTCHDYVVQECLRYLDSFVPAMTEDLREVVNRSVSMLEDHVRDIQKVDALLELEADTSMDNMIEMSGGGLDETLTIEGAPNPYQECNQKVNNVIENLTEYLEQVHFAISQEGYTPENDYVLQVLREQCDICRKILSLEGIKEYERYIAYENYIMFLVFIIHNISVMDVFQWCLINTGIDRLTQPKTHIFVDHRKKQEISPFQRVVFASDIPKFLNLHDYFTSIIYNAFQYPTTDYFAKASSGTDINYLPVSENAIDALFRQVSRRITNEEDMEMYARLANTAKSASEPFQNRLSALDELFDMYLGQGRTLEDSIRSLGMSREYVSYRTAKLYLSLYYSTPTCLDEFVDILKQFPFQIVGLSAENAQMEDDNAFAMDSFEGDMNQPMQTGGAKPDSLSLLNSIPIATSTGYYIAIIAITVMSLLVIITKVADVNKNNLKTKMKGVIMPIILTSIGLLLLAFTDGYAHDILMLGLIVIVSFVIISRLRKSSGLATI